MLGPTMVRSISRAACSSSAATRPLLSDVARRSAACVGAQPEFGVRRMHRVAHDGDEVVCEGIEVDLVPEALREPLECARSIVFAAIEALVDESLDPWPQGPEQ